LSHFEVGQLFSASHIKAKNATGIILIKNSSRPSTQYCLKIVSDSCS
jgi:hypothetical protein